MVRIARYMRRQHPIRTVLVANDITQVELAAAIGWSSVYVSKANRGLIPASARYRRACAAYLGIDESVLFNLDDAPVVAAS